MKLKRILVVSTKDPFSKGGDSVLINSLEQELSKTFEVEKIFLPFSTDPNLLENQIEAIRNLKFSYGDLAITSRPLSYAIKHPNKVVWFMHHIRYLYDLWDTELNPLKDKKDKEKYTDLKQKLVKYDNQFLKECKKVFAISENVKKRLMLYNGIKAEVIYPPIPNSDKYSSKDYGDYFFFPSRIAPNKRQHLVIEALKYTKGNYKLILAGQKDDKYFSTKIKPLLQDNSIKQKVEVLDFIDDQRKIDLYSQCLAVLFTPFDEDYGYVTLESFYSSKAVITTIDSGGPLEFVTENTGIICKPDPQEIAKQMDYLYNNKKVAIQLGQNARKFIVQKNINWENVVTKLTKSTSFIPKIFG